MASYFFHKQDWSIDTVAPGIKLPVPVVLMIVPLMGALFLMFLPFIGFGLVLYAIARKIARVSEPVFTPMPIPGEAHFTGAPGKEHGEAMDSVLDEIAKEVQDRRSQK